MEALISSSLEEICCSGPRGLSLSSLWPTLTPKPTPATKASLWSNLRSIPSLQFTVAGEDDAPSSGDDARIHRFEDAEKLGLKITANQHLRDCFVGLYDASSSNFSDRDRRALDRLLAARTSGITQSQLGKDLGIDGNNLYYVVKTLECRGLIVRQPVVVKKKEAENSSTVTTNLIYLSRYAKHLGVQQRFEIEQSVDGEECRDAVEDGDGLLVRDFLPAMKAICDKLEEANDKVLVISDIKQDLGYRGIGPAGHKSWRVICNRLKEACIVEEFDAKVNEKVVRCLRLLKEFSTENFEQVTKCERKCQQNDQLVELDIEHQIYNMVDAKGTEGAIFMEVCGRLGIENKRDFRSRDMVSKFGMHLRKEIYKRTVAARVWTSGNFNSQQLSQGKSKIVRQEKKTTNLDVGNPDVPDRPAVTFVDMTSNVDNVTPRKQSNIETDSEFACESPKEGKLGNVREFLHESRGLASDAALDLVSLEMEKHAASTDIVPSTFSKQPMALTTEASTDIVPSTFSKQPMALTTDAALREQRILEYLQDEKFIFRAELHRWLVSHEKDKCTKLDRKTIDRILDKLQKQGHCKCVTINVPAVTNCSRSRRTMVVLHPSLESFPPELVGEIHDRLRSFEKEIRGQRSSRRKTHEPLPVLDGVMRTQLRVGSTDNAAQSEAMRANGFVLAKMVRAKLLHGFLWGYLSSFPGWDDVLLSRMHTCTYKHFELEVAVKAIPIELFLQVVGSTQNFDDMLEKCRKGLRLCDIPIEDYKCVMDTRATGRLSYIIDILRRLKLIRLVKDGNSEEGTKGAHATCIHAKCTHALELRPYVEEPLSLRATPNIRSLDLRPRIRHDFILSNRAAVDEYWKILEYCYAAAGPTAVVHAFPGSAVPELCLERSWASVRVMSADQRAELLKRIVKDDPHKKISYKDCEKIAKDLNLSLQQVLRVYYDKRQKRLNTFQGNNEEHPPSKRKRSSASNKRRNHVEPSSSTPGRCDSENEQSGEMGLPTSPGTLNKFLEEKDLPISREHTDCFPAFEEDADHLTPAEEQESDAECYSLISQCATLRRKATGRSRFLWTDEKDRLLVIQYAKHRAALGVKFHRVDWSTLPELPAPPRICARRMSTLNRNKYFRKALMKLCTVLSERYVKQLEKVNCMSSNTNSNEHRVLVRCSIVEGLDRRCSAGNRCIEEADSDEEQWDDFTHKTVKRAFEDVLLCKQVAKMDASKKGRCAPGEQPDLNSNIKEYNSKESEWLSSGSVNEVAQNLDPEKRKDSTKRSRWLRIHQKFMKLLNERSSVSRQVHESLAVSNAVELLKLVFLSTSTAPNSQNLLAETLRRYSEHDLFAAFSYLREKKIMIGGNGDQPFQLSQQFLHSISKSPFPADTGQRAAKISSWLHDRQKELVEGGINLSADLHCGDIFQLFALVSSGELSIYPCVPLEGVGEAEDLRSLKRKSEDDELSDGHKAKKLKSLADSELFSRREKGFPGIMVHMQRATFLTTDAVEMLKDGGAYVSNLDLNDKATAVLGEKISPSSYHGEHMQEAPQSVSVIPTAGWSTCSPWDAMAGYADHLLLNPPGAEQVPCFNPQVFKNVYAAIQAAGDQGLSTEEVSQVVGENIHEHVINVLQAFGQVLKVNAYVSARVVDALYHSKYFLTSSAGFHHELKLDSVKKSLQRSNDNHLIYQPRNCCVVGANSQTGVITADNDVHKITILNLPEEDVPLDGTQVNHGHRGHWQGENPMGLTNTSENIESFCQESSVPLLPWINGDGTINKLVYNGLVRRVFGTVMQNPGILEDGIIQRIDVLNPQGCRSLLELMILDKHLVVRDMLQSTSRGPPPLLGTLLRNSYRESNTVYRRHFFANPMSASLL